MKPLPQGAYRELTPENHRCTTTFSCPGVHTLPEADDDYYIIGIYVDHVGTSLEGRVGEGEVLLRISKALVRLAILDDIRTTLAPKPKDG